MFAFGIYAVFLFTALISAAVIFYGAKHSYHRWQALGKEAELLAAQLSSDGCKFNAAQSSSGSVVRGGVESASLTRRHSTARPAALGRTSASADGAGRSNALQVKRHSGLSAVA